MHVRTGPFPRASVRAAAGYLVPSRWHGPLPLRRMKRVAQQSVDGEGTVDQAVPRAGRGEGQLIGHGRREVAPRGHEGHGRDGRAARGRRWRCARTGLATVARGGGRSGDHGRKRLQHRPVEDDKVSFKPTADAVCVRIGSRATPCLYPPRVPLEVSRRRGRRGDVPLHMRPVHHDEGRRPPGTPAQAVHALRLTQVGHHGHRWLRRGACFQDRGQDHKPGGRCRRGRVRSRWARGRKGARVLLRHGRAQPARGARQRRRRRGA